MPESINESIYPGIEKVNQQTTQVNPRSLRVFVGEVSPALAATAITASSRVIANAWTIKKYRGRVSDGWMWMRPDIMKAV